MFGLTLIATGALTFNSEAIFSILSSSENDSTLIQYIPSSIDFLISDSDFPTPE